MLRFIKPSIFLLFVASLSLVSCKKDKAERAAPSDNTTEVKTLELTSVPSSAVYGRDYTFKLRFDKLKKEDVSEYGIAYSPWINRSGDKTCLIGGSGTFTFKFGATPKDAGTVETITKTISYSDFNDANYRAYAILKNGTIVYGEIMHIVFA